MEISFGTWIIVVFDFTYFYSFLFSVINPFYVVLVRMTNFLPFTCSCCLFPIKLRRSLTRCKENDECPRTTYRNMIKLHNFYFLFYILFSFSLALWKWQIYHIYLGGERVKADFRKWLGNCANKRHQSVNNHHTHAIGGF